MDNYKEYVLGESAKKYIQQQISDGGRSLSTLFLDSGKISNCRVHTYLPDNFDIAHIENYQYGGVAKCNFTGLWIDKKVKEFLLEKDNNIVVYEHAMASPTDPWLKKSEIKPFILKDDVYFIIFSSEATNTSYMEKTRRFAGSAWLLIGLMISPSENYKSIIQNPDNIVLSDLVNNVKKVFVSAFDGEGYLLAEM